MLTRADIIHLAELARITISEEEIAAFEKELPAILDFVASLNTVDTGEVLPMTGGVESTNVFRNDQDAPPPIGDPVKIQGAFRKKNNSGAMVVPHVFGDARTE